MRLKSQRKTMLSTEQTTLAEYERASSRDDRDKCYKESFRFRMVASFCAAMRFELAPAMMYCSRMRGGCTKVLGFMFQSVICHIVNGHLYIPIE